MRSVLRRARYKNKRNINSAAESPSRQLARSAVNLQRVKRKSLLTSRPNFCRHLVPITLQLEPIPVPPVALVPQTFSCLDSRYELVHILGSCTLNFRLHCGAGAKAGASTGAASEARRGTETDAGRPRPSRAPLWELAASLRRPLECIAVLLARRLAPLSMRHASSI